MENLETIQLIKEQINTYQDTYDYEFSRLCVLENEKQSLKKEISAIKPREEPYCDYADTKEFKDEKKKRFRFYNIDRDIEQQRYKCVEASISERTLRKLLGDINEQIGTKS